MSSEEQIKAQKFKLLGISEEDFDALPIEDRLSRLTDLKEEKQGDLNIELEDYDEYDARQRQLNELITETLSVLSHYREAETRVLDLTTAYREAVKAERSVIGRIGAYTRWYRVAEARLDTARMRHYAIKIAVEREKVPSLKAGVSLLREELRPLPSIWVIARKLDELESARDIYRERLSDVIAYKRIIQHRIFSMESLIEEIDREIKELKLPVEPIKHRYREVSFEVLKSIEYASSRTGSDIDIEVVVAGTIKAMLPTRYESNEQLWINEIEVIIRDSMREVIDDCINEEYFPVTEDADIRCNVNDIRITRRTIINVSSMYVGLIVPITKKQLMSVFRDELERHTIMSIGLVQFMRSNVIGGTKSRNVGAERAIHDCIKKRSANVLEEVLSYTIPLEIDELMRSISE